MNYVYTIYHNQGDQRFLYPGTETDPFVTGFTGVIPDDVVVKRQESVVPDHVSSLFEWVFVRHNRDDRPDAKTAPSLSVGDVVALSEYEAAEFVQTFWRTVDSVGFKPVGILTNVTEREE